MTRLLATAALLGTLLAAPAWADTMPSKMHHPAHHAVHHAAAMHKDAMSSDRHRHHMMQGDDSAEMLNQKAMQDHHKGM